MASQSPLPTIRKTSSRKSSQSSSATSEDGSYTSSSGSENNTTIKSASTEPSTSDYDFLSHGDLRSPSREVTRERSLRKKSHKHSSSSSSISKLTYPGSQPLPLDAQEKSVKTKSKKSTKKQETIEKSRKREDRRKSDTSDIKPKANSDDEEDTAIANSFSTLDVHSRPPNRRSSSSQQRQSKQHNRKPSASSITKATTVSPPASPRPSFSSPKQASQHTQFHVEEGIHERSGDLEAQVRRLAQKEAERVFSRGAKLSRGIEEIEARRREKRRDEALRGMVEGAVEKWEEGR